MPFRLTLRAPMALTLIRIPSSASPKISVVLMITPTSLHALLTLASSPRRPSHSLGPSTSTSAVSNAMDWKATLIRAHASTHRVSIQHGASELPLIVACDTVTVPPPLLVSVTLFEVPVPTRTLEKAIWGGADRQQWGLLPTASPPSVPQPDRRAVATVTSTAHKAKPNVRGRGIAVLRQVRQNPRMAMGRRKDQNNRMSRVPREALAKGGIPFIGA